MAKLRISHGDGWQDVTIDKTRFSIGRSAECDYVVKSGFVSRHHCEIVTDEAGQFHIRDSGTRLGTMVNDQPVRQQSLAFGDKIRLSNRFEATFLDDTGTGHTRTMREMRAELAMARPHLVGLDEPVEGREFVLSQDRCMVGRDPSCDISIPLDTVSKFHAEILIDGDQITVVDLNSSNGTFVDNQRVNRAVVAPDARLRFDRVTFRLERSKLEVGKTGTLVRLPLAMEEGLVKPAGLRGDETQPNNLEAVPEPVLKRQPAEAPTPSKHGMSGGKIALIVILLVVVLGAGGTLAWFVIQKLLSQA